jgi:5-methyltetrahydrofolate--homocysteine methyltransferase
LVKEIAMSNNLEMISESVKKGDHEQAVKQVKEALVSGTRATDILEKGLVPGIQALGELFKNGQAFLPEILISVRAMNRGLEELKSHLIDAQAQKKGTVVLGTVKGDLHDIGKNLVRMMLEGNGYRVIDLGVDVQIEKFVEAVKANRPNILALSTLLTTTMPMMKSVIESLIEANIRNSLKVMIGGAPVNRAYADEIGAEGFAENCVTAVDETKRLMMLR